MKSSVLFWNIWGHRNPQGVHAYLKGHMDRLDFCCLTEVTSMKQPYDPVPRVHTSIARKEPPTYINGREQLTAEFGDKFDIVYASPFYASWECDLTKKTYDDIGFGSALLIKKGVRVLEADSIPIIFDAENKLGRVLQYVAYEAGGVRSLLVHLHGLWIAENTKGDHPFREQQSLDTLLHIEKIAQRHDINRVVFGGDLNLDLHTNAIALLERGHGVTEGWRNLIRSLGINNTRTPAYRKFHEPDASRFADYVFVTQNIKVHRFQVDTDVAASDHAPVSITFS